MLRMFNRRTDICPSLDTPVEYVCVVERTSVQPKDGDWDSDIASPIAQCPAARSSHAELSRHHSIGATLLKPPRHRTRRAIFTPDTSFKASLLWLSLSVLSVCCFLIKKFT